MIEGITLRITRIAASIAAVSAVSLTLVPVALAQSPPNPDPRLEGAVASDQPELKERGKAAQKAYLASKPLAEIDCATSARELAAETRKVTVGRFNGGDEMAEYFNNGSYRITRCDSRGRLKIQQVVDRYLDRWGRAIYNPSSTTVPEGGLYATTTVDRMLEGLAQDDIDELAKGSLQRAGTVDSTVQPSLAVRARAKAAQGVDRCADVHGYAYLNGGRRWPARGYTYRVNRASFGFNDNYRYMIGWAFWYWAHTYHDCTSPPSYSTTDRVTFVEGPDTTSLGMAQDAINVVAMTNTIRAQCGNFAIGCNRSWGPNWGGAQYESDTLVAPEGWQVQATNGQWFPVHWGDVLGGWNNGWSNLDFNGMMTHEIGHSLSLAHYSASQQTMYPVMECWTPNYCGDWARTLGAGDINALYVLYPW